MTSSQPSLYTVIELFLLNTLHHPRTRKPLNGFITYSSPYLTNHPNHQAHAGTISAGPPRLARRRVYQDPPPHRPSLPERLLNPPHCRVRPPGLGRRTTRGDRRSLDDDCERHGAQREAVGKALGRGGFEDCEYLQDGGWDDLCLWKKLCTIVLHCLQVCTI